MFVLFKNQWKKLQQWVRHFLSGSFWDPEGRSPHTWLWICNIILLCFYLVTFYELCPNSLHQAGSSSRSGTFGLFWVPGLAPDTKSTNWKVFPQSSSYLIMNFIYEYILYTLYMNTFIYVWIHYIWIHFRFTLNALLHVIQFCITWGKTRNKYSKYCEEKRIIFIPTDQMRKL